MNPIDPKYSHDAAKFVYQTPDVRQVNQGVPPEKPFKITASRKTKKSRNDIKKKKLPGDDKTSLSKLLGF
jgi:hypothetical protein